MHWFLKKIGLPAVLWVVVLGILVSGLTAGATDIRVLSAAEMRQVARGAAPDCDSHSIVTDTCGDFLNYCAMLTQDKCQGACHGCSGGNVKETVCVFFRVKPWTFVCKHNDVAKGCGVYYDQATCMWANGQCNCVSQHNTTIDCPQKQDSKDPEKCIRVP